MVSASPTAISDTSVLIIGDGVIGLSIAYALGRTGADCLIVGARNAGMASTAAAGLLLPGLEQLPPEARAFFAASIETYPAFIDELRAFDPTLRLIQGLIQITSRTESGGHGHQRRLPDDGAIDNVRLTAALRAAVAAHHSVAMLEDDPVLSVALTGSRIEGTTRTGLRLRADRVVIAAGAWASQIRGLPRPLPVSPLKGQMLALGASPLELPVVGDDVYLVPRAGETLVGATVERAGFDLTIDAGALESLRAAAIRICPALANASIARSWAGTRPATPDMLPILGADPDDERVIYACGHAKNGILLTPATADATRELLLDGASRIDISRFAIGRFGTVQP